MSGIGKRIKGKSLTVGLHLLAKDKLLIQHSANKTYGLQVFDTGGRNLIEEDVFLNLPVMCSRDGRVYVVEQPSPGKEGNLPNPRIKVYEFQLSK